MPELVDVPMFDLPAEPQWREIPVDEYLQLAETNQPLTVGATISDPDGDRFGTPHMLTTWQTSDGRPLLRHQCWPVGHTIGHARPLPLRDDPARRADRRWLAPRHPLRVLPVRGHLPQRRRPPVVSWLRTERRR